jgi:flavin reductase (DIM6/NTAB) family NADH-FMN oxidoreductase RutF
MNAVEDSKVHQSVSSSAASTHERRRAVPDPRALRRCFGRFQTGVTVVTYHVGDEIRGATVNSFTSVSMDPPLVLVSLARSTQACAALEDVPFAINVLRSDQLDVAFQFAGRARPRLSVNWDVAVSDEDPPTLADAVAVFRCRPWRRYDGGDHVLQIGEITGFEHRAGDPLAFGDGRFLSTGLPILDGPLVFSLDGPPSPGWVGAAQRFHAMPEH